ncbi:MAG: DEAD/DEAH box helicase [Chloroflexi bacterium]|nr:DEAD/DEAH box helicase [Chloroflexota bacterium]
MHIVHAAWVPEETNLFVQRGGLYVWVETDVPLGQTRSEPVADHPRHLAGEALATFLAEQLGVRRTGPDALADALEHKYVLLPSADGRPLPSVEMAPYVDDDWPLEYTLSPWRVWCYRVPRVIPVLNDIQFLALHAPEGFQLGADLLFWHQCAQTIRGVVARDQYIPALRAQAAERSKGRRKQRGPAVTFHAGWEIVSATYDDAIERLSAVMPIACRAGLNGPDDPTLYRAEPLLRHFSECLLHDVVAATPLTAKHEQQVAGTLLERCFQSAHAGHPAVSAPLSRTATQAHWGTPVQLAPSPDVLLAEYRQWLDWRTKLTRSQTDAGFTLCFRLEEASPTDPDAWKLHFLAVARRDPSLRLSLAEYWARSGTAREETARPFGTDFEKQLILGLGAAARIYPTLWGGLATDRPTGCTLTLDEAFAFLQESAWVLEDAGYSIMVPAWWTPEGRRRAKVRVKTTTRSSKGSSSVATGHLSLDALISYQYQLSIAGQEVTEAEWRQLVEAKTPLVQFRGQWMELNREHMHQLLQFWRTHQREAPEMALVDLLKIGADREDLEWDHAAAVQDMLGRLQDKSAFAPIDDPAGLHGTLRDYQKRGVAWLQYLESLGLNACLADDMGLGKTLQVIARLVIEREEAPNLQPTLIVAPTSVLGNWRKEIERFAPHLRTLVHQGAERVKDERRFKAACKGHDVVLTSFALARLDEKVLRAQTWHRVVVDEAQNIKNPQAAQTRAVLKLPAAHRLALTGTPVENRLRDLWSIFNFLNPGYLGKEAQFRQSFELPIQKGHDPQKSLTLKKLAEPFILRRVKTDRRIIDDLPDKIEQTLYCALTPEQASLYEAVVKDVARQLDDAEGMERRGLILATLLRLKQICNHPAQFLADGSAFSQERSQKLERLGEMADELIENGESALIFTQFTEIGAALERYLGHTRHVPTFYLHGGTSAARRDRMVADFQVPDAPPALFVLSLRAGGVGLNLTKANHVFHFDRWWNPSVEDQATDRAFRIGQRKNVFVHKFVALGTVEEKIDAMIEAKKRLSSIVVGADEGWLTELDNETFKDLIALRRGAVLE